MLFCSPLCFHTPYLNGVDVRHISCEHLVLWRLIVILEERRSLPIDWTLYLNSMNGSFFLQNLNWRRLSLIPNEQIAFPINGHHAVSKIALILESTRSLGPKANFAKKCIFLCFSAKHVSFDINLKNGLIANCLCERRFFVWKSSLRKTIFYYFFRL